MAPPEKKRVAVIGSGISGLSSAWLLHRAGHHVTLYEAEERCGGHTLTADAAGVPVDLGFQVYNLTTYPHLVGFLEALGVDTEPSDMSFSLSIDDGRLEWASVGDLDTVFAQRSNALSPTFLRMVYDVVRFGKEAPKVLEPSSAASYRDVALGAYLDSNGYSQAFRRHYLLPMCAAVWSVPNAQVLEFPIQMLVRFWVNHHLLDLTQRPKWRVVKGRSQAYVRAVTAEIPEVLTSTPIASLERLASGGVRVTPAAASGAPARDYDAALLAVHSDTALKILGEGATGAEREVLGAIPYSNNDVYLHTDESLMPRLKKAWSSWNFLGTSGDGEGGAVCVTYWLNRLQNLPPSAPQLFVTLNPLHPPAAAKTLRRLDLAHPAFSFASYRAQERVASLQGAGGVYFAGAWCGFGFHEDGIKAGIEAATLLGAKVPWTPISTSPKVSFSEAFFLGIFDKFARATIRFGRLRMILPNGEERLYGNGQDIEAPVPKGQEWRGLPRRAATMRVLSMAAFKKIVFKHDVGMGEAYMDGDYVVDDLGALLALVVANARALNEQRGLLGAFSWIGDRLLHWAHLQRSNTIEGSRRNIEEHYDAGNAMYSLFLDPTMTYSCGIHTGPGESLEQAQYNKIDAIIDAAGIGPGDSVLEIGCGWGAFAIRAVQRTGCRITGLTLSKEQLAEAAKRVEAAGLGDRITLLLCDYRDCPGAGTYDRVVSVEMIEAVGHEHLRSYFAQIGRMLKPGGRAVIQVIAQPDERYESYCRSSDFIREHIFPGGHLPSMGAMVEAARGTGLGVVRVRDIGPDYAITLRAWREAWEREREAALSLGYSQRFWLKYQFYFAYCEAAFDAKYIHDYHVTWVKDGAAAVGAAGPSSSAASGGAAVGGAAAALGEAVRQELPSDPITQALLAFFFFLAGMLVRGHPLLWIPPLAFTALALAHGAAHYAGSALHTPYRLYDAPTAAAWRAAAVHLPYSAAAGAAAAALAAARPDALLALLPGAPAAPPLAPREAAAAGALTTAATGFFAFRLWLLVKQRRGALAVAQYTALLLVYGVASYKQAHVPLLAAALCCELAAVPALARRMRPAGRRGDALLALERLAFVLLRLLPHLALAALAAGAPAGAFATPAHRALAGAGLGVTLLVDAAKARRLFSASAAGAAPVIKVHTE
ncbi:cyclopropane fatty acid synthase [Raphidocelis subcapitata]|uniref:Cyclopropane fatty acid synthase n=1 Tax=Raphidocelis subcapitata TaxID=307507 RepID=A0A2V0NJS4_9CHLO|nr:cyclopropane fatty acid synthase [Raphidocelis subcapitata]|eukprot:GBF87498.1 cyclopropane fatty acid synthase [Raphidocelis subcapitata]